MQDQRLSNEIGRSHYDAIVVGGGVIGLSIAWRLARCGLHTMLLESREIGSGSSSAAGAMLSPALDVEDFDEDLLRLQAESLHRFPDFARRLGLETASSTGFHSEGTLFVATYPDEVPELRALEERHEQLGMETVWLSGEEASELEPGLPRVEAALMAQSSCHVEPAGLMDALLRAYLGAGGELHEHTPVGGIDLEEDRARGVILGDKERVSADAVVVCAGAWSRTIRGIPEFRRASLRGRRAAAVAVSLGDPPLAGRVIRHRDLYLVPCAESGTLVIGSTHGLPEQRAFTTTGDVFELLLGACRILPDVYGQELLDSWTAFRPETTDSRPMIGPSVVKNLWLATGHARFGFLLAPLTAEILADGIMNDGMHRRWKSISPQRMLRVS